MYFHNASAGGCSSVMLLDTQLKNGFIILSNISELVKSKGQKVDNLAFSLMSGVVNKT